MLTRFKENNASRQNIVDEERGSLSAQLATVRKKITNTTDAISKRPKSQALLKKLIFLEEDEADILSKLAQLQQQTTAPIILTMEQSRTSAHKIQTDLNSKDPTFVRQKLLGIISDVFIDRIGKNIISRVVYYHTPSNKKSVK